MPHARKPKISAPPGLNLAHKDESEVDIAGKFEALRSEILHLQDRDNLLEKVFLFIDVDDLKLAVVKSGHSLKASLPSVEDVAGLPCELLSFSLSSGQQNGADSDGEPVIDTFPFDDSDIFSMLNGMVESMTEIPPILDSWSRSVECLPSIHCELELHADSLCTQRIRLRQEHDQRVAIVKRSCAAMDLLGKSGTIDELNSAAFLSKGTYLESVNFIDVFLDGFNGYVTSRPGLSYGSRTYRVQI